MAQTRSTQKKQNSKPVEKTQPDESQTPSEEQKAVQETPETEAAETENAEPTSSDTGEQDENTPEEGAEGAETDDEGQDDPTDPTDDEKPAEAPQDGKERVSNGSVPKGKIIPVGGKVEFEAHQEGSVIVVDEDVFQEVNLPHTKRKSYTLIHRKGKHLPTRSLRKKG